MSFMGKRGHPSRFLREWPNTGCRRPHSICPSQPPVIEVLDRGWLDNRKVRRDIEVAWCEQAEMTCLPSLLDAIVDSVRWRIATRHHPARGKNAVTYALKCLRDQRRADRSRRLAAAERTQPAFQPRRHRAP